MAIQLYFCKNDFDTQKIRRFFKERRINVQEVDLKKHAPGARELKLFASKAGGYAALVDAKAKGEKADYVRQLSLEDVIEQELLENPALIRTPIVRDGNRVLFGFDEKALGEWLKGVGK